MWPQHYAHEIHPVELHELSLQELTGAPPSHRGRLMYLKQRGIPAEAVQFRDIGPKRGHLRNLVQAIEHDFYSGPVTRYPEVQPPPARGVRLRAREVGGPPRSPGYRSSGPMASRELVTGRRDGRAAALFQRMKDRSDQYVIDESTVPPSHYQQDQYGQAQLDHRPWQKSPWEVAENDPLGLPDRAFEAPAPKPKPKPKLQQPVQVQQRGPPGYSQVDSIRQRQHAPHQANKPVKIGCTWRGESSTTRFHSGVRPYEMNYNRTAKGWDMGQFRGDLIDNGDEYYEEHWGIGRGYDDYDNRPQFNQPRRGDVARSRQVVRNVIGPRAWGGESGDL